MFALNGTAPPPGPRLIGARATAAVARSGACVCICAGTWAPALTPAWTADLDWTSPWTGTWTLLGPSAKKDTCLNATDTGPRTPVQTRTRALDPNPDPDLDLDADLRAAPAWSWPRLLTPSRTPGPQAPDLSAPGADSCQRGPGPPLGRGLDPLPAPSAPRSYSRPRSDLARADAARGPRCSLGVTCRRRVEAS